jgi:hypothetical protein
MMNGKRVLLKILAVIGTILIWFPIAATVLISVIGSIQAGQFLFDFLMPMELFPAILVGGILLLWAAWKAHSRVKMIALGFVVMVVMLIGIQAFAVLTGIASGPATPSAWHWAVITAAIVFYSLALVDVAAAGILLVFDLFKNRPVAA